MSKPALLASTAVLALIAGSGPAASNPVSTAKPATFHLSAVPPSVLYDQNSNFGTGIVSQNFSSSFYVYDSAAADDFVIPAGHKWKIAEVDVTGAYYNGSGPADSEIVTFYTDRKGYPHAVKGTFTLNCTDSRGSFACTLPGKGQILSGGKSGRQYWVSVVANCDFITCGEWGWVQNTKIRKYEGVWENPHNGFGTGCTTWTRNSACFLMPGDYAFDLRGKKS